MTIQGFKTQFSSAGLDASKVFEQKKTSKLELPGDERKPSTSFADMLQDGVSQVNEMQKTADKMAVDVSTGKNENLHETMLAMTKAELGFNFMVQVRNKALEAYQEIMRMPV